MKKRVNIRISKKMVGIFVIFMLCLIAIIYTFKIYKIDILKSIREKNKQIIENADITVIDVTNMVTGSDINHQHIFKTMYDDTEHWEQCTICFEKSNIVNHNFTTTWTLRI